MPDTGAAPHAALIAAIAARQDRTAFAALFGHFAPRVKAYMVRSGMNAVRAEELAQETMLMVWRKAALFDPARAGAATWIFTIARNLRIDAIRRDTRLNAYEPDPAFEPEEPEAADAPLLHAERERLARTALEQLPEEQARVVLLSFFHDKPHTEIAGDLGIPLGTVKSRLRLAMKRLRDLLGEMKP